MIIRRAKAMHIRVEDLSLELADRDGSVCRVLDGIDFEVGSGERFAVLGPSGAGKSTLLRMLNRLQEPTGGRIFLGEAEIGEIDVVELRRRCAMVLQQPVPLPGTVEDNLLVGPRLRGYDLGEARRRIPELLERVRLDRNLRCRPAAVLSVGQQQRVALARALMNDPEILLLDEPTAALDPGTAAAVLDLVVALNRELGLTTVVATHDFTGARRLAVRAAVIIGGRLAAMGAPEALKSSQDELVAAFLGGA